MNRIFLDRSQLSLPAGLPPSGTSELFVAALDRDQHHYLTKVLRLRPGAQIIVQLATGERWLAQVLPNGDRLSLNQLLPELPPEPVVITLMAALPKTGFDEVVRQATELGVGQILPVFSDRTVPKPKERSGKAQTETKGDRWQRIAQEAAEQCERREIPVIQPPQPLKAALSQLAPSGLCYLCVARNLADLTETWADRPPTPSLVSCLQQDLSRQQPLAPVIGPGDRPQITLAIGPEGGWTLAEIEAAIAAGFTPVSLGPRILRAVTAPLVALAQVAAAIEPLYPPPAPL